MLFLPHRSLRFGISRIKEPNRLTIYLVERAADAGRLSAGRLGPSIAGFYSADPEGSFAVSNRESTVIKGTPEWQQKLLTDPQTSGGLLVSCAPEAAAQVLATFHDAGFAQAAIVGHLTEGNPQVNVRSIL